MTAPIGSYLPFPVELQDDIQNTLNANPDVDSKDEQIRVVATLADRNAIPAGVRFIGMIVRVTTDATNGDGRLYELRAGLTNSKWFDAGVPIGRLSRRYADSPTVIGSDGNPVDDFIWGKEGIGEVFFNTTDNGPAQVASTRMGEAGVGSEKVLKYMEDSISFVGDSRVDDERGFGTDPLKFNIATYQYLIINGNLTATGSVSFQDASLFDVNNLAGARVFAGSNIAPYISSFSSGWGSTAATSALRGHQPAFEFTITANGAGIAANPTITMDANLFPLGQNMSFYKIFASSDVAAFTTKITTVTSSFSSLTIKYRGTPVAGKTYSFRVVMICDLAGSGF